MSFKEMAIAYTIACAAGAWFGWWSHETYGEPRIVEKPVPCEHAEAFSDVKHWLGCKNQSLWSCLHMQCELTPPRDDDTRYLRGDGTWGRLPR